MDIQVSMPINLFDKTIEEIDMAKRRMAVTKHDIKKELDFLKDSGRTESNRLTTLNDRLKLEKTKIADLKHKIDVYWDYVILRALDPARPVFKNVGYNQMLMDFLGLQNKEVRRKKARVLKHGFAEMSGDYFCFLSKDKVWRKFGVLVQDHKKDKNGKRIAHQKLGVYQVKGHKKYHTKKGQINKKTGKSFKEGEILKFAKKIEVKVLKFKVSKDQLRVDKLKLAAAVAYYKWRTDVKYNKFNDDLREKNHDIEIEVTCDKLARRVGYLCAASGWKVRNELFHCGYIELCPKKIKVAENVSYEQAKEQFPLHQGIQEETQLAYFYKKNEMAVYGVKCYGVCVNGYKAIEYCRKNAKNDSKPKRRYVLQYVKELHDCDGWSARKIFGYMNHLFENSSINDYLFDLLENDSNFYFLEWAKSNLEKAKGVLSKEEIALCNFSFS